MKTLEESKNALVAFKYDNVSQACYLGNLGPFHGDLELLDDVDSPDGVYYVPNCTTLTS